MQVFMPWPEFEWSARMTDTQRLQKGIVEAYQIIKCLTGATQGWASHPAVKMWSHHTVPLLQYTGVMTKVWNERGGKGEAVFGHAEADVARYFEWHGEDDQVKGMPWAVGNREFHLSHQLNLFRKRPDIYGPVFRMRGVVTVPIAGKHTARHEFGASTGRALVDADDEPYLWPRQGGLLQVGTQADARKYHSVFGGHIDETGRLLVTLAEAQNRYERDLPDAVTFYERNLGWLRQENDFAIGCERRYILPKSRRTPSWMQ